jgi:hypothetical protein
VRRGLALALLGLAAGAVACSPGEDERVVELSFEGTPPPAEARLRVNGCRGDDRYTMDVADGSGDATAPYALDDIEHAGNAFLTLHRLGGRIVACGRVVD